MEKTIDIIEIFGKQGAWSLQGEGLYAGTPSTFIRTFGCNLACKFGLTNDPVLATFYERQIRSYPSKFPNKTLEEMPVHHKFCDTYYSIFPEYAKYASSYTIDQLVSKVSEMCSNYDDKAHIVFTGGEPLLPLWQEVYVQLFPKFNTELNVKHITFETNTTQPLVCDFAKDFNISISFSMSPKLSSAGYSIAENCCPDVVWQYIETAEKTKGNVWFKFVVNKETDIEEIRQYMTKVGIPIDSGRYPIMLMPEGGTKQQLEKNERNVYDLCAKYGYHYSPRLQVSICNNGIGI